MDGGFFGFLADVPGYDQRPGTIDRMNARRSMFVTPFAEEIWGARVYDIAAHDGRWAYAFAEAGAAQVVGVEARAEIIERFAAFPDPALKARVELRCNDLFAETEAEVAAGARYDVVGVLGILYHIMDHFRLLQLIRALGPRLVIVDSEFLLRPAPVIGLVKERTDNPLNAAPQVPGQKVAIKGVPSFAAMEAMAEALDFRLEWLDWEALPAAARKGVADYYRPANMRRATCILRPRSA